MKKKKIKKFLMSSSSGGGSGSVQAAAPGTSSDGSLPNPQVNTSKYKTYAKAVDVALRSFEAANEWADLIKALAALSKVLQSNAKFGDIPKPVIVAKRLSQCLHQALPMGVHLKALETYRLIFDILGPQLPKLLYLFAVGLFPLMDHCFIKVKTELFNIFETYLLPMGQNLRPALPGFLAAVLLGLEEGTEFFDKSVSVLDRACSGCGPCWFYACLWEAVLGSPSVRLSAMLYVNAKFDKARPLDDQIAIVGDHVNHMVAALCATADDSGSPLVQRNLLDFLSAAFPLDSTNLTREDFVQLIRRCIFVVLRRDMSLNRRLYTWFMNPTGGAIAVSSLPVGDDRIDTSFFENRALPMIVDALDEYMQQDMVEIPQSTNYLDKKEVEQQQFTEVRVCRLLTYLHDRSDIGRPVIRRVLPLFLSKAARHCPTPTAAAGSQNKVEEQFDRSSVRLSLNLNQSFSSFRIASNTPEEQRKIDERRLDEVGKTLNLLLKALEDGYLWEFFADWFEQLFVEKRTAEQISEYAKVVIFCLSTCNLDSALNVRAEFLPKLLRAMLSGLTEERLRWADTVAILDLLAVCSRMLTEISLAGSLPVESTSAEPSPISSPTKHINKGIINAEQAAVEDCINNSLKLLASACRLYWSSRGQQRFSLLSTACQLASQFSLHPIYCLSSSEEDQSSNETVLPEWLNELLKVLNADEWRTQMAANDCSDLAARATALELLVSVYLQAASVAHQHTAVQQRRQSFTIETAGQNQGTSGNTETEGTTVLLKPLLSESHLKKLEHDRLFERCGAAVWHGMGSAWCGDEHQRLARLLVLIHSRKPLEPSSDIEQIIVAALTASDQVANTDAARTFHRIWALTRAVEDQQPIVYVKPFNRVVMLLLGVLADDSVSRARPDLKCVASSWFIDCAKHNDLPRIVQMLSTMLMNPVTARVSIQYVMQESRLGKNQLSSLPSQVAAYTLITADGKQRLYHVEGDGHEGTWKSELRNRLLLSSVEEKQAADVKAPVPVCPVLSGDVPNFDEDTDSLDADVMSLSQAYGVEPAVVEVVQYLVDCIVDEEESELEAQRRFNETLGSAPPMGQAVYRLERAHSIEESIASSSTEQPETVAVRSSRSTSAERPNISESLTRMKKGHRRQDSLQESIFSMTGELKAFDAELLRPSTEAEAGGTGLFHELHVHMLLYGESGRHVDLGRAERAFRILTALLGPRCAPVPNRMMLSCLLSSGTAAQSGEPALAGSLVDLMNKHVRAILGQHFWTTSPEEEGSKHRHFSLLELLITVSLHFLRSYYLNSPISPVTEEDLVTSWKCKIAALDFLSDLLCELSSMLTEQQSRTFIVFVQSILGRAKLQKCLLHLLLTAVQDPRTIEDSDKSQPLSVSISKFNEGYADDENRRMAGLLSAYSRSLLSLTAQAIRLESDMKNGLMSFSDQNASGIMLDRLWISQQLYNAPAHRGTISSRDQPASLVELRAFLLVVLNALKKRPERHEMWLQFVVQVLPWMERSLATVVVRVVEQLCKNVETAMAACFSKATQEMVGTDQGAKEDAMQGFPANFIVMTMETLTTLVHFCVVDTCATGSSTIQTGTAVAQPTQTASTGGTSMVGQAMSAIPGTKGATELISNLVRVFTFGDSSSGTGVTLSKLDASRQGGAGWRQAKNDMLTSLPHALATICDVWTVVRSGEPARLPLGTTQQLRRLVLDLLAPIAQHHQYSFLPALSLVWLTRSASGACAQRKADPDQPCFTYTSSQLDIANLLLSLKVIPFEDLISAVSDHLKEAGVKANKVGIQIEKGTFPTEAPLLELVHGCVRALPAAQLRVCWPSLQALFSEAPLSSLTPRAVFLLFIILCDFVRVAGATHIVEDKAMSRAVQDACQRLTDAVSAIVGWQLEKTTWLQRTLVVKQDQAPTIRSQDASPSVESGGTPMYTPMTSMASISMGAPSEQTSLRGSTHSLMNRPPSLESSSHSSSALDKKSSSNLRGSVKDTNNNKRDPAHSTQALFLLAENLAELVDCICKSDDKERLVPVLHAVWGNVLPYLKAKHARNARFFLASSQLLASMSSFNYMRPVWKKTTLELLLDASFFKMDLQSLKQWLIVTDHLMTHDKTSFKDLLKSIAYTPNASFSIMTSKEQEYEARSQAVKRLAFVVLGSELDQYHAQISDIQERLSENLRVSQAPSVRSAVFLCIRVLLLRLRPNSLTGIWPIMVTELVHVLLQMEQQLSGEANGGDDMTSSRDDSWMQLYLAACKLLETLCTLPAGYLAQFQMCHWAFVNSISANKADMFIPFAGRINKLLSTKFGKLTPEEISSSSASLCSMKLLTSFDELRPFFFALATQNKGVPGEQSSKGRDAVCLSGSLSHKNAVTRLEHALYVDFAEHWQL